MEAEDYCLTYEQLYKIKSGSDSSRENLSFTEKDTLSNTVRQLRKKLEFFPFLTIENLRGIGYRLVIK
jgi:DNA-binding response OmpR family regulator